MIRGFHNWYFKGNFYFNVAVIRAKKTKKLKKTATSGSCNLRHVLVRILELFGVNSTFSIFSFPWNSGISNIMVLEKSVCKKDIFSKVSNTFYFPLGCGSKFIFGTFWDIRVDFLKNINSQLWASYAKGYKGLKRANSINFEGRYMETGPFYNDENTCN